MCLRLFEFRFVQYQSYFCSLMRWFYTLTYMILVITSFVFKNLEVHYTTEGMYGQLIRWQT